MVWLVSLTRLLMHSTLKIWNNSYCVKKGGHIDYVHSLQLHKHKTALNCCQCYVLLFPGHVLFSLHCTVMRELHSKEGVVTEDECRGIKRISVSDHRLDQLSLVLCVKPKKQLKTAIKILKDQQNEMGIFGHEIHRALGLLLGE